MITAVDTNALLAILYEDSYTVMSEDELRHAFKKGRIVITPIVYAELAADGHFETTADLDQFLDDLGINLAEPSQEALYTAGERFREYCDRRPNHLQCPQCGENSSAVCPACGELLYPRQHIAADFLIGGHATVDGDALVSFDAGFYESYFPSLSVLPK